MLTIGSKVQGTKDSVPRVTPGTARFEGFVIEIESAECSDVGEALYLVRYSKTCTWDALHGNTKEWHYGSELTTIQF